MDDAACDQLLDKARARGRKKKRALGPDFKAHVLACGQEAVKNGGRLEVFLREIGLHRSRYYRWGARQRRGESLEDRKPVARNRWWRLTKDIKAKVLKFTKEYHEIASQWTIGRLAGVSGSSVAKIWQETTRKIQTVSIIIPKALGVCEWLRLHACWALDTMCVKVSGAMLYLMVLIEEYSRLMLGWELCSEKTPGHAVNLVRKTIACLGLNPLVLKHDNGTEFTGAEFQASLAAAGILSLASPAYYAPFNGKCERANRNMRKFTKNVEEQPEAGIPDLVGAVRRGFRVINDVLPRRIFGGQTSREVYDSGRMYAAEEQGWLIGRMQEVQKRLELEHERRRRYYDLRRRAIVEAVSSMNLCEVRYGQKSQALSTPVCLKG